MELFEFFYKLRNFYGVELFNHLKGWDDSMMGFNPDYNQFPSIFLSTLGIALGMFLIYYYFANSPRFNRWWNWLIELAVVAISSFEYGCLVVNMDIRSGNIAPSIVSYIGSTNALMFGIYNMLLASLMFVLFSLLFRHWSKNCKHSPWTSVFTRLNHN